MDAIDYAIKIIKKNKILFLPNLFLFIIHLITFTLFFNFIGITGLNVAREGIKIIYDSSLLPVQLLIFLILMTFIDSFIYAYKYGLIKNILNKKKYSLKTLTYFVNQHIKKIIKIQFFIYMVFYLPFIGLYLTLQIFNFKQEIFYLILPIILMYLFFISIRILYIYPTLTFHRYGAYNTIKDDFHFVKTHFSISLVAWLTVLLINLSTILLTTSVKNYLPYLLNETFIYLAIIGLITLEVFMQTLEHVYIFYTYKKNL